MAQTILAISRTDALLKQVRMLLSGRCNVKTSQSKIEAVHFAKRFRPAIIILDDNLLGSGTFELIRSMRDELELHYTFFIVMSNHLQEYNPFRIKSMGADDFIPKPIDEVPFINKITKTIESVVFSRSRDPKHNREYFPKSVEAFDNAIVYRGFEEDPQPALNSNYTPKNNGTSKIGVQMSHDDFLSKNEKPQENDMDDYVDPVEVFMSNAFGDTGSHLVAPADTNTDQQEHFQDTEDSHSNSIDDKAIREMTYQMIKEKLEFLTQKKIELAATRILEKKIDNILHDLAPEIKKMVEEALKKQQ